MNRSSSARRRAEQKLKSRANPPPGDSGIFIRLVLCGVIFVCMVAVKFLFPEAAGNIRQSVGDLLGRNADFQEAFAAVGRAVSGEEPAGDSLRDAYTAVFNPTAPETGQENSAPNAEENPEAEEQNAQPPEPENPQYTALPELDLDAVSETVVDLDAPPEEEPDDTATETLSYVYTMPALPENASLEQRNLGFAYSSPIQGVLSSTFGWREHPIEGGSKFHYGVDLAAPEGTDILAFANGAVYATGESSSLGNYIMLQHESGYITLYAHCSKVTAAGGSVAMGEKIAEVGSTGLATGPHLHFELHDGDLYLNPIFYVEVG
ncbi:MAG: M23 family metallopeptidase [Oscillospiraceae bacterium]|nr:M23 family metallopeptidase [Oscillospiraceae bacterium]